MATITPVAATSNSTVTYQAAAGGGDTAALGSSTRGTLIVRNGAGSPITVTLTAVIACSQGFIHNTVVTAAASSDTEIAIPASCINPTTGNCAVGYSSVTSVTVALVTS